MRKPKNCQKCQKVIPFLWDDRMNDEATNTDNGLELFFIGSYGEFIDTLDDPFKVDLCHDCAHDLADWLRIDAHNWHTHKPGSGMHPDHHDES